MKKFWCNGKKDFCESDEDCSSCKHYDKTGGEDIEIPVELVPKSEYDQLQKKYELAVAEREANVRGFADSIKMIKEDMAREIFAEIDNCIHEKRWNSTKFFLSEILNTIAELKKKYIGEADDTKNQD